jgi:hypothetical protein
LIVFNQLLDLRFVVLNQFVDLCLVAVGMLDLVVESFHALLSELLANVFIAFEVADNLRSTLLFAHLGICQNKV